jgi:hypothetical protein
MQQLAGAIGDPQTTPCSRFGVPDLGCALEGDRAWAQHGQQVASHWRSSASATIVRVVAAFVTSRLTSAPMTSLPSRLIGTSMRRFATKTVFRRVQGSRCQIAPSSRRCSIRRTRRAG